MTPYEPGTVAVATVRGVPNVRVTRSACEGWSSVDLVEGSLWHEDGWVTDIRPLVVLDLATANDTISADEVAETAIQTLRKSPFLSDTRLAAQIKEQATGLRIPEPGLWGVVKECPSGIVYVRDRSDEDAADFAWASVSGDRVRWTQIDNPTLIRQGVDS